MQDPRPSAASFWRADHQSLSVSLQAIGRWPRRRGHEMVQGSVPVPQPGRRRDRPVDEVKRILDGALERPAVSEPRGDRGGQRAAGAVGRRSVEPRVGEAAHRAVRSEEHTSELQSLAYLVCRLLLEKKKNYNGLLLV